MYYLLRMFDQKTSVIFRASFPLTVVDLVCRVLTDHVNESMNTENELQD